MGDEAAKNIVEPAYLCDEKKKDGYVHVIVSAKGLKTSRSLKGMKIIRKAENAVVNSTFEERSMEVTVTGLDKGSLKGKCYQLKIKKLPHDIVKENSYMEVEDDRVVLYLNKRRRHPGTLSSSPDSRRRRMRGRVRTHREAEQRGCKAA